MGYTTDFSGAFAIEPPLSAEQVAYLQKFSQTRRMKRDVAKLKAMYGEQNPDWPGSGYGVDGGYYVGGTGEHWVSGVETDVIDRNNRRVGSLACGASGYPPQMVSFWSGIRTRSSTSTWRGCGT